MKNISILSLFISIMLIGVIFITACSSTRSGNGSDNEKNNTEPLVCTKEYMPLCGVDGKTYGNKCMAGNVEIAYEGECKSQIANPASTLCVDNGGVLTIRTEVGGSQVGYCILGKTECEEWSLFRGECASAHICTDQEKQAEACTMEYMPVCGNDGQTYGNKCSACAADIKYWTQGEC